MNNIGRVVERMRMQEFKVGRYIVSCKTALRHIIPLFQSLHWLPIPQRIQCKINTLFCKCITRTAPSYPCDCLQLYTPSRTLCSSSDTDSLHIPRNRLSTAGSRAFFVFGPSFSSSSFLFSSSFLQWPYLFSRTESVFSLNLKTCCSVPRCYLPPPQFSCLLSK